MLRTSGRFIKTPKQWEDYIRSEEKDGTGPIPRKKLLHKNNFNCGSCEQIFPNKSCLETHIKTSHRPSSAIIKSAIPSKASVREYMCKYCDVKFSIRQTLLDHKKICDSRLRHREDKVCLLCSNSYKFQSSLNRHLNSVHGNATQFQCKYCSKKFARNYQLKNHISSYHDILVIQQDSDSKYTLKVQNPKRDFSVSMHKSGQEDMIKINDTITSFANFTKYFELLQCDTIDVTNFIGSDTGSKCLVTSKANGVVIGRDSIVICNLNK